MVFYMIMPLIFGAFGNFLLPTQLGVHDVAFPRLNSAAFWFLPGGLIMLMLLVCDDRRYQRMNCFNIRELQGILKRRFFTDLVNSSDHREILSSSMIGLRFKTNNNANLDHDVLSFFKLGTNNVNKARAISYENSYYNPSNIFKHSNSSFIFPQSVGFYSVSSLLSSLVNLVNVKPLVSIVSLFSFSTYSNFFTILKSNFSFYTLSNKKTADLSYSSNDSSATTFSSKNTSFTDSTLFNFSEKENISRFSRFSNPIISYDYKCGNYIGI
jgi:hypothetical protein